MRTAGKIAAPRWPWWLKTLLAFELLVCFGPMTLMLMMGAVLTPIQVIALFLEPLLWEGPVQVIGSVLCGVAGLGTLSFLLGRLFESSGAATIRRPLLVLGGAIVGVIPLIDALVSPILGWRIVAAMPIVSGMHVLFLCRGMLFPSARKP